MLALNGPAAVYAFRHPATLALNHGASLQKLQLRNLQFVDLDLLGAPCLSSITLSHVDDDSALCKLSLPSTLQRFTFEGSHLFSARQIRPGREQRIDQAGLDSFIAWDWLCTVWDAFIARVFTSLDHPVYWAVSLECTCWQSVFDVFAGLHQPRAADTVCKESFRRTILDVLVKAGRRPHVIKYYGL